MPSDKSTLVRAIVTVARNRGGRPFIANNHEAAVLAVLSGEPRVKLLQADGTQTEFEHYMKPDEAVELLQLALELFDAADEDAEFDPAGPGSLVPRIFGGIPL